MNSKHYLVIAFLCSIVLTSCKKEEPKVEPTSEPQPLEHPLLKVGNKWVFETVKVDSIGNEFFVGTDSIVIEKDTVIDGVKWTRSIFMGMHYFRRSWQIILYRDSAGILVNSLGEKVLEKYENKGEVSTRFIYGLGKLQEESHSFLKPNDTTVTVPAGTFKVTSIETMVKIYGRNGHFGITHNYDWFSEDLGVSIYSTYSYAWPILVGINEHYERRLVRYKVQ